MRDLYQAAQISEQAVLRYRKRMLKASNNFVILMHAIDQYRLRHPGCGIEKMYYQLDVQLMGRDKFILFCKEMGYQIKPYRIATRTTLSGHYQWPNLIEGMLSSRINQVWQSDITYFRVGKKFFYLTFIIDIYSRKIVGYAVSSTLEVKANIEALKKALKSRSSDQLQGLIHHSDKGSQYTSGAYLALLAEHGCIPSMGAKGQDNAYAERINGIIKNEYLIYRSIANLTQLNRWVRQAVNQYNRERHHRGLPGRQSPNSFEQALLTLNRREQPSFVIHSESRPVKRMSKYKLNGIDSALRSVNVCPI